MTPATSAMGTTVLVDPRPALVREPAASSPTAS
jgi:hypothetical protein